MVFVLGIILLGAAIYYFRPINLRSKEASCYLHEQHAPLLEIKDALPERFIVFDFETTGLYADQHEIVEIGAIRIHRDSELHDTFQTIVLTENPLSEFIINLTGITQEMVNSEGIAINEAMRDFKEFVGDLPMVAYNAKFDSSFLKEASVKTGIVFNNKISCALKEARRAWPGRPSYKLADLAKTGNITTSGAHRALEDARIAMIVYAAARRTSKPARPTT